MDKGEGLALSKTVLALSHHVTTLNVVTYDADVDQVDIEEEDHLNNRDDAIIESGDDYDAGIFSIAKDYSSKDYDTLTDEQKEEMTLSTVCTRQTEQNNILSAEGFVLARDAVVHFVQ